MNSDEIRLSRGADHIVAGSNFAPLLPGLLPTRLRKAQLRLDASFVNNRRLAIRKIPFSRVFYVIYIYVYLCVCMLCIYVLEYKSELKRSPRSLKSKHENFQESKSLERTQKRKHNETRCEEARSTGFRVFHGPENKSETT